MCRLYVFFFQAEDGIRDLTVTGVQTCALPILARHSARRGIARMFAVAAVLMLPVAAWPMTHQGWSAIPGKAWIGLALVKIGRASCRGRVEDSVVAGSFKKKKKSNGLVGIDQER